MRSLDEPADFSLRRHALPAFGPSLLFGFSQGAMLPVVVHSAIAMGATTAQAGGVFALISVGALLSNIPAGKIIDRIGERWSIMLASAGTAVGLTACFVAVNLLMFAAGVFVTGVTSSVFLLARQAYLTDLVPHGRRGRAMSVLGGTKRVGAFIGPFAGASVIALWDTRATYVLALIAILGAGAIAATSHERRTPQTPGKETVPLRAVVREHRRSFVTVGSGILFLSAIRQARQLVIPLWAEHLHIDAAHSSLIVGVSVGVEAVVFYPAGVLTDRWQRRAVATTCCLVVAASVISIPLTHSAVWLTVAAMVLGIGNGFGSGIVSTIGADLSPAVGRAVFLGVWAELADTGSALGPMTLSVVAAASTLGAGVVSAGVLGVIGAVILWKWVPRPGPLQQIKRM